MTAVFIPPRAAFNKRFAAPYRLDIAPRARTIAGHALIRLLDARGATIATYSRITWAYEALRWMVERDGGKCASISTIKAGMANDYRGRVADQLERRAAARIRRKALKAAWKARRREGERYLRRVMGVNWTNDA